MGWREHDHGTLRVKQRVSNYAAVSSGTRRFLRIANTSYNFVGLNNIVVRYGSTNFIQPVVQIDTYSLIGIIVLDDGTSCNWVSAMVT